MDIVSFRQKGDYSKVTGWLEKLKRLQFLRSLDRYGQEGVNALRSATPVDTGLTASSWYYQIKESEDSVMLEFHNSNINNGVPIAIVLQYGHVTPNGGWVEGRDYINPAIQPLFDKKAKYAWEEVKRV